MSLFFNSERLRTKERSRKDKMSGGKRPALLSCCFACWKLCVPNQGL